MALVLDEKTQKAFDKLISDHEKQTTKQMAALRKSFIRTIKAHVTEAVVGMEREAAREVKTSYGSLLEKLADVE